MSNKTTKGLSSFALKIIAITTMFIDHTGLILFPEDSIMYAVCRMIGRISFPIFAFLIAEGAYYTKDKKKYILRLGIFAIISEFFFDLSIHGTPFVLEYQNIFFTLVLGLLSIIGYEFSSKKQIKIINFIFPVVCSLIAELINASYGLFGVLLIFSFYATRNLKMSGIILRLFFIFLLSIDFVVGLNVLQTFGIMAIIPISYYCGKKGATVNKYIFYLFYPAHLFILYLIKLLILNF